MKNKTIIGLTSSAILIGLCGYELGIYQASRTHEEIKNNRVAYISSSSDSKTTKSDADLTPDEVSEREGISAEQIVVKITDEGYVTSHGDHFHYYNGKVPFDAIISEELIMKDPNYSFNQSDVVNEVKDGYIIKVNGQYYLYLKDPSHRTNVRTKEEITRQQQGNSQKNHGPSSIKNPTNADSEQHYTTDDGYIFNPTDVLKDLGDGFIVPHGNHFHYIPKAALSSKELAAAQACWNQKQGKSSQASHGNDTIFFNTPSQNSGYGNVNYQPTYPNNSIPSAPTTSITPTFNGIIQNPSGNQSSQPINNLIQSNDLSVLLGQLYSQPLTSRHVESDGLVFDPAKITKRDTEGVVVPHGDHFHFILYRQMSALEEKIARMIPIGSTIVSAPLSPKKPETETKKTTDENTSSATSNSKEESKSEEPATVYSAKEIAAAKKAGRYVTSEDGYIFDPADIISDEGIQYIVKHKDYVAWIAKESLSKKELKAAEEFCKQHQIPEPKEDDISNFDANKESAQTVYDRAKVAKIIPIERMPYNAAYASMYKNGYIVIPHHTHFHNIAVEWFNDPEAFKAPVGYSLEDFFSTVKYYLAHPEERPVSKYGWGHKTKNAPTSPTVPAKPEENLSDSSKLHPERIGKPNSQIVYTKEEIEAAKAAGRYTTDDGYIFEPSDIVEDAGEAYIVPHMTHSHWIPKADLSKKELAAAIAYTKEKGIKPKNEQDNGSKNEATDTDIEEKGDKDTTEETESAISIYSRVEAKNIIPKEMMPYGLAGATEYQNGRIRIPSSPIFDNLSLANFDYGLYSIPQGYSLEDLMATIKFYIEQSKTSNNADRSQPTVEAQPTFNSPSGPSTNQVDTPADYSISINEKENNQQDIKQDKDESQATVQDEELQN